MINMAVIKVTTVKAVAKQKNTTNMALTKALTAKVVTLLNIMINMVLIRGITENKRVLYDLVCLHNAQNFIFFKFDIMTLLLTIGL